MGEIPAEFGGPNIDEPLHSNAAENTSFVSAVTSTSIVSAVTSTSMQLLTEALTSTTRAVSTKLTTVTEDEDSVAEWILNATDTYGNDTGWLNETSTVAPSGGPGFFSQLFEDRPWLIWLIAGAIILLIFCLFITAFIVIVYNKEKKRKKRQNEEGSSRTATGSSFWQKCTLCVKSKKEEESEKNAVKNNLSPRVPLPAIGTSQGIIAGELDGYQGGHVPVKRLEPIEQEKQQQETSAGHKEDEMAETGEELNSGCVEDFDEPALMGVNIEVLKGVPVIYVKPNEWRDLPKFPLA